MAKSAPTPAKLSRPKLHSAVPRERLFRLLDEQRERPTVWIAAPPGAGKTTLVATYLAARKLPSIWYQVDSGDADPATFFYYLRQAAQQAAPRERKPLPLLSPEYLSDLPGFARRFFRELFARLPTPAVLVLDNYQEVATDSALHHIMQDALGEIREGINVIVISHAEPPPQCARALANSLIGQVGWQELRLTLAETSAIAGTRQELAEETVHALQDQSDGWAAGLVLMLERFKRTGTVNADSQSQNMDTVFNYFAGQIFDRTSAGTRDFLMRTALLPNMTAQTAEAISANGEADALLDQLYRGHLFIDRRSGAELSYQYHSLFRKFLLSKLRETTAPQEWQMLNSRAAALLEYSDPMEAFSLYCGSEDWSRAARLVVALAPKLAEQGRLQTLREAIAALPDGSRTEQPWLKYWEGMSWFDVDQARARSFLEPAFESFGVAGNGLGQLICAAAIAESYYYEWANYAPLDHWIPVLAELLAREIELPSVEIALRTYAGALSGMLCRQPEHPLLPVMATKIEQLLTQEANINHRVAAANVLLNYRAWSGDEEKQAELIRLMAPVANDPHVSALNRVWWLRYHGSFLVDQNRLKEADAMLEAAEATVKQNGLVGSRAEMAVVCHRLFDALYQFKLAAAEPLLARCEALLTPARKMDYPYYHYYRVMYALLMNDSRRAVAEGELALSLAQEVGVPAIQIPAVQNMLVTALVADGNYSRALFVLGAARSHGTAKQKAGFDLAILLIKAITVLPEVGVALSPAARTALLRAVERARELDNQQFFRMLPRAVAKLAYHALGAGIEPEFIRRLVRVRSLPAPAPTLEAWPWSIKIYTLGRFALVIDDVPLRSTGKAQRKPLDLLKCLVAFGGREVSMATLTQALWPEADGDSGRTAFEMTLHRLRKLLGRDDAVLLSDGRLSLSPHTVWVDVWALERLLGYAEAELKRGGQERPQAPGEIHEPLFHLYQGEFLDRDEEQPWLLGMRQKLHSKLLRYVTALGQHWEASGHWEHAERLYKRGIELDPLAEELYRRLIIAYIKRDQPAAALEVYRRCRQMLSVVLGMKPSAETETLHRSLLER
jgi:LuxR family transcriptional regulator, maltose regulon positive regulatory protein